MTGRIPGGMPICTECYEYRTNSPTGICSRCHQDRVKDSFMERFAVPHPIRFPLPLDTELPCHGEWAEFDKKHTTKRARKMCASCPALEWCLEWGIENDEYGTRGGHSQAERRRIKAGTLARRDFTLIA